MEIELNFRLDGNGRTANSKANSDENTDVKDQCEREIDYQPKTTLTNLTLDGESADRNDHRQWLDDLLFDCEISDCGLMPRTFWVPAQGMKPRCQVEQLALDIFHAHVPPDLDYDISTSGAEWWAQIRPSPEDTGRYSMHDDQPDKLSKTGISFHWDKDEDLRLLMGGTTYLHPHLSTVTYLTDLGSPTLAFSNRVQALTGEWIDPPDSGIDGFVSWPKTGKHFSFDGRFLHAAPADLMEPGAFEKQLELPKSSNNNNNDNATDNSQQLKILKRRHRRVTFLVNIWLNYKPFDVAPFPETMIDKMSGTDETKRKRFELKNGDNKETRRSESESIVLTGSKVESGSTNTELFRWPMGDCYSTEFIEARMPLSSIRELASTGGNVQIHWNRGEDGEGLGVRLFHDVTDVPEKEGAVGKRSNSDDEASPRVRQRTSSDVGEC